jgi:hypothetical protein
MDRAGLKEQLARVISAYVTPSSANAFGNVSDGTITLCGKLIRTVIRFENQPSHIHKSFNIDLPGPWTTYGDVDVPLVSCDAPLGDPTAGTEPSTRRRRHGEEDIDSTIYQTVPGFQFGYFPFYTNPWPK